MPVNTMYAGINYKALYECKWDPMTVTNKYIVFAGIKILAC